MSRVDAFVAANAFLGVMRAMISAGDGKSPPQDEIVRSLERMLVYLARQDADA